MRTLFVNPTTRKKSKRRTKKRRARPAAKAPRVRRRSKRRSRRRNAGITPFVQNPGLRVNPLRVNPRHRRRSKRRNPEFKLKPMLMNAGMTLAGSATGAGINFLALRRLENVWLRNGARILLGLAAGAGLQNAFGGATAGSLLYPSFAELALAMDLMGENTTTEADLEELSADLEDVLEEIDIDDDEDDIF